MVKTRYAPIEMDGYSQCTREETQHKFEYLEGFLAGKLVEGRAKAMVITHLEEAFMWVEKAIIHEQVSRYAKAKLEAERRAQPDVSLNYGIKEPSSD